MPADTRDSFQDIATPPETRESRDLRAGTAIALLLIVATNGRQGERSMLEQIADKMRALKGVMTAVEKQFGKGAVMTLGDDEDPEPVAVIPTGSLALDLATGIGGFPRGRVVEIYGPESSGKTTLALHAIAQSQRAGGVAAFIDAEHALDVAYARAIGVET